MVSGSGIDLPIDGDRAIGFYTTRHVRAAEQRDADRIALGLVRAEGLPGGEYAAVNPGGLPQPGVEHSFPIGVLRGLFGRKASGHTFYARE